MALSQADRIAFSSQIIGAAAQIKGLQGAQAQLQVQITKLQGLDTANKNLFDPVNTFVTAYQAEMSDLDGNGRTTIIEQDIVDAANKKFQNHFFPNDTATTVPSIASLHNVWPRTSPYALGFGLGKSYVEAYTPVTKEGDLITTILGYITAAGSNTDIENTSGQHCVVTGTCDLVMYTDQVTCEANMGVWTPGPDSIVSFPAVQTLKTNIVAAVNSLKTFLTTEAGVIVTNDPNVTNQTNNNAAISNINTVIIPALNTWLAYVDFNTAHGQSTCAGFNGYNSNLLAPTKLHSNQLAALQTALNNRNTFVTTRTSQLNTVLGTIVQDINTGDITSSSGLYGKRYGYLALRLGILNGSLTQLASAQNATGAQTSIMGSISGTAATYGGFLPTSAFKASANGTSTISLVTPTLFAAGDTVYVMADGQEELQRAVKSIAGDNVTLNDIVPAKYTTSSNLRIYKDLS